MPREEMVSISGGNIKMGKISSVSLPEIVTCRKDCECCKKCYAAKIERLRKMVKVAYQRNWKILQNDPALYWRQVEAAIMLQRYFRFHVSGDIPSKKYLKNMVEISTRQPHCQILCFTKRFDFVNDFVTNGGKIPENLQIIFSGWKGLSMENPFHFSEAHVLYKDGFTTARPDAKMCGGNCTECAMTGVGCWTLKKGEQIVFKEH